MPKIPVYQAEVAAGGLPPIRNATGADFGAGQADGLRDVGQAMEGAAAVVHQKQAEDDVTNVRVALAQARAAWDVKFRDESAKSTPGDPSFAGKFVQDFQDYLGQNEQIAQTREGQHTYKLLSGELTGHFAEKAGVFAVQSAGVKAKLDWTTSLNAYGTSIMTDPTSYSSVLNQAIAEIRDPNGQYGRLDANTRQQLEMQARNTLGSSYINGLVNAGAPELAEKQLRDGRLDSQVDPKTLEILTRRAEAGVKQKQVAAEHEDAQLRKAEKDRVDDENTKLNDKFMKGRVTWADVQAANLPANGEGSQDHWMNKLRQQTKDILEKPAKTSPSVFNDLRARIDLPDGDPQKITSRDAPWQYYGKGLSEPDAARLERRVMDNRSDDGQKFSQLETSFINGVKPRLDKSTMNNLDAGGAERVYQFKYFVDQKVEEAKKAKEDPRELFNPSSPKYLGKAVATFQTGPQRAQADLAGRVNASIEKSAPKRKSLDEIFGKP